MVCETVKTENEEGVTDDFVSLATSHLSGKMG